METTCELQVGHHLFPPSLLERLGNTTGEAALVADQLIQLAESDTGARHEVQEALRTFGEDLQFRMARKSELLKQPLRELSQRAGEVGGAAAALIDLKMQVEALDPADVDFVQGWFFRLLGYLLFVGSPVKRYFSRYESAAPSLAAIVKSLEKGCDGLKRDNVILRADQAELKALLAELTGAAAYLQAIDARLNQRLADDSCAGSVCDELLFPLQQRIQDVLQQLLVSRQGVLTGALIVRNNEEMIRGVNRALTATRKALAVAAALARVLTDQRIVLDGVGAADFGAGQIIGDGVRQLREPGTAAHRPAAPAQPDVDMLRQAFVDIRSALGDIDSFRRDVLPEMSRSIATLDHLTIEAAALVRLRPVEAVPA